MEACRLHWEDPSSVTSCLLHPPWSLWPMTWKGQRREWWHCQLGLPCCAILGKFPHLYGLSLLICIDGPGVEVAQEGLLAGAAGSVWGSSHTGSPGRVWEVGPPAMLNGHCATGTAREGGTGSSRLASPCAPGLALLPWPSLPATSRPLGPYLCLINARWIPWS